MRAGVTPVPIPNTMVKTRAAENTKLATAWEDRWLPDSFLGIWTTLNQQIIINQRLVIMYIENFTQIQTNRDRFDTEKYQIYKYRETARMFIFCKHESYS